MAGRGLKSLQGPKQEARGVRTPSGAAPHARQAQPRGGTFAQHVAAEDAELAGAGRRSSGAGGPVSPSNRPPVSTRRRKFCL